MFQVFRYGDSPSPIP